MAKFLEIFSIVVLVVCVCSAEPPRSSRRFRTKSRFLAKQEIAEDVPAPTPYPAADRPDVAFDIPSENSEVLEDQAAATSPDQIYGPPDQVYGPPETEAVPAEPQEDIDVNPEFQRLRVNSRLTQQRRASRTGQLKKAAPLKSAAQVQPIQPVQPQLQQQILSQPILLADGRIVYSILA